RQRDRLAGSYTHLCRRARLVDLAAGPAFGEHRRDLELDLPRPERPRAHPEAALRGDQRDAVAPVHGHARAGPDLGLAALEHQHARAEPARALAAAGAGRDAADAQLAALDPAARVREGAVERLHAARLGP